MSDPADPPQQAVESTEVDDTSRVNGFPTPSSSPRVSGTAIAGVVFGVLGLVIPLVFLPAIVCGRVAQARIRLAKGNFNVRETNKRARGGLLYRSDGRSVEGLFDAWGNPFVVELDADYDGRLRFKLGGKRVSLDARRVAVYSAGSDKKLGTDDDVKTW